MQDFVVGSVLSSLLGLVRRGAGWGDATLGRLSLLVLLAFGRAASIRSGSARSFEARASLAGAERRGVPSPSRGCPMGDGLLCCGCHPFVGVCPSVRQPCLGCQYLIPVVNYGATRWWPTRLSPSKPTHTIAYANQTLPSPPQARANPENRRS
jgi:hypothetical protein